jgi:hypothetical protein
MSAARMATCAEHRAPVNPERPGSEWPRYQIAGDRVCEPVSIYFTSADSLGPGDHRDDVRADCT